MGKNGRKKQKQRKITVRQNPPDRIKMAKFSGTVPSNKNALIMQGYVGVPPHVKIKSFSILR
jgi:hypothetical protein